MRLLPQRCVFKWFLSACVQEAGVFGHHLTQEMRDNFFMESAFLAAATQLGRGGLGGLADMFGQMPGM